MIIYVPFKSGVPFFSELLGDSLVTRHKFRAEDLQLFGAILKIYSFLRPDALVL